MYSVLDFVDLDMCFQSHKLVAPKKSPGRQPPGFETVWGSDLMSDASQMTFDAELRAFLSYFPAVYDS